MAKYNLVVDSQMISSLMSCPRLFRNRFELDLQARDGKSNSLECGSMVHIIKEFYNKARIDGKSRAEAILIGFEAGNEYVRPYSEINKYVRDAEHKGMLNTPIENATIHLSGGRKIECIGWKWVIETMNQYFDHYRNDSFTIVSAEETRGKLFYEDDMMRILYKAKFDEIWDLPNGFASCDTKTSKQRRDTLSLNNQFLGHCAILSSRQVIVDKVGFQKSLKPSEKFDRVMINYSMDRIAEYVLDTVPHYCRMLIAFKEADYFPPNHTHCENKYGKCAFVGACETDRNLRDEYLRLHFEKGKAWDITNDD